MALLDRWRVSQYSNNRESQDICCSSDGMIVLNVGRGGAQYTGSLQLSTDAGHWWGVPGNSPTTYWSGGCMSSNGQIMAACSNNKLVSPGGALYTSHDGGQTWTARDSIRYWTKMACSDDGTRMYANGYNTQIYVSTDAGLTWTPKGVSKIWGSMVCSANGQIVVASGGTSLYVSTDYGNTWTVAPGLPAKSWTCAINASGSAIFIAGTAGAAMYKSTDYGATWTIVKSQTYYWQSITCTPDGVNIIATFNGGTPIISNDGGSTWHDSTTLASSSSYLKSCCSDDGIRAYIGTSSATYMTPQLETATTTPTSGPAAGGTEITVTLEPDCKFIPSAKILVNGYTLQNIQVVNDTTIRGTTPAFSEGTYDIMVGQGLYEFNADTEGSFTYIAASQLFMDGFDAEYQGALDPKWSSSIGSNSILPSSGRRGTGCLSLSGEAYGPILSTSQEMIVGLAVKPQSGQTLKITFWDGNAVPVYFMLDATGYLYIMDPADDSIIQGHPSTVPAGLWAYIELYSNNSTGDWSITKNGTSVASGTYALTGTGYDSFGLEGVALIDDLYQMNGSSITPFGGCRVDTLPLNANSTPQEWVPDTGNAWERLNIDDGSIFATTVGETSLFTVADLTHVPTAIYGVQVTGYGSSPEFTPTGPTINAALITGSTQGSSSTLLDVPVALRESYIQNPDTAADWTEADVNALEVGVVVTA